MKTFFNKFNIIEIIILLKYEKLEYDELFHLIEEHKLSLTDNNVIQIIKKHKRLLLNENKLKNLYDKIDEELIDVGKFPRTKLSKDFDYSSYSANDRWKYSFVYGNFEYYILTKYQLKIKK